MKKILSIFVMGAVLLGTPLAAYAQFDSSQKEAIENIVRDFIKNNPDALISVLENHAKTQAESAAEKMDERLTALPSGLDYPMTPTAGAEDADITVVEFFDYNCGYCKRVLPDVQRLLDTDKKVKVIFKELPILSPASEFAARYAIASNKQGKYMEYHAKLMESTGRLTEDTVKSLAKDVGLDLAQLEKDAQSQDVTDALAHNMGVAQELGVRGTPFFLVGKRKVPGAIGFTRMQTLIDLERNATDG